MRLINADELYEKVCNLEAQALSHVEKIMHDEAKHEEWKIWSAILAERTAFKHDVFDTPTIYEVLSDVGQKDETCVWKSLDEREISCES